MAIMENQNTKMEHCRNCEFWLGERQSTRGGTAVRCDVNAKAGCSAPGQSKSVVFSEHAACINHKFKKWHEIK